MKARDVMSAGPASVRTSAPLREAIDVLHSLNVRHLPIVDHRGELVGLVSDRDLRVLSLSHLVREGRLDDAAARLERPVSEFMSRGIFTVGPDTDIRDIANLMTDQQIGAVPVVNADGTLVGMVSYVDLLRELVPLAPPGDLAGRNST
jgi:acetoin utilization protein AcuB